MREQLSQYLRPFYDDDEGLVETIAGVHFSMNGHLGKVHDAEQLLLKPMASKPVAETKDVVHARQLETPHVQQNTVPETGQLPQQSQKPPQSRKPFVPPPMPPPSPVDRAGPTSS